MVKYLIVVCHPEPKSMCSSLGNAAIDAIQKAGHEVQVTRIYEDNFDPLSSRKNFTSVKNPDYFKPQIEEMHATEVQGFADDVEAELKKLEWCDVLIFQFPLWWFHLPAGLKGWCDRVLAMGRAYGGGRFYGNGTFKGKHAILSLTTGGPGPAYEPNGFNGDIMGILRPIHRGIFQFVGFNVLAPHIVYAPAHISQEERQEEIKKWEERVVQLSSEQAIEVGPYH